jgi:hypothetical protein
MGTSSASKMQGMLSRVNFVKGKGSMQYLKHTLAVAILGAAVPAMAEQAPFSSAGPFFDFGLTGQPGGSLGQPGFAPAPFLSNSNAGQVQQILQARKNSGLLLAVKVIEPLTNPQSVAIFNSFKVDYVFADFEDAAAVGRTRALADQVLASTTSRNAYVGNFNVYPNAGNDTTRPGANNTVAQSFQNRPVSQDYFDAQGRQGTNRGKQMANQALYPGAPDYRNPAAGDSNAPNIRAALFTLPIQRQTFATNGLLNRGVPTASASTAYNTPFTQATNLAGGSYNGAQNVPYVTRFNNWGNNSLDSDGNPANGYNFVQNAATPSNGQLLSRGDFSAMVLHYRLRGADSVHLFNESNGSVVGYSDVQEQADVKNGWAAAGDSAGVVNGIFSRKNYGFANLTNVVGDLGGTTGDTSPRSTEVAGAVWSGVFDKSGTNNRRLAIILSNLSSVTKTIDLPNLVGGFRTISGASGADDDYVIAAGTHRLLTFSLLNNQWRLSNNEVVFTDSNRNGVGIPEPTSMALAGIGALGLLARRRRSA